MNSVIIWTEVGVVFLLLALSFFFSAAETALTAVSKPRLKKLIARHPRRALGFKLWLEDPNKLLTTIVIAINIANISAASLAIKISVQLASWYHWNAWLVWGLTTLGLTACVIIFCEMAPKIIAIHSPLKVVMWVIRPVMFVQRILSPLTGALVHVTSKALGLVGIKQVTSLPIVTEDDIRTMIDIGKEEGAIAKQEGAMLQSVLAFQDTIVREVMVPRNEMVMVSATADYHDVLETVVGRGLSRIPVYMGKQENIVGVLYAKDFLSIIKDEKLFKLKDIYRPACFVPETQKISQLLLEFQRQRLHQAVVVDEYGGVAGLVTLEDIIEELVGEIRDEYDKAEEDNITKIAERRYLVKGRTDIDDVNRELGLKLKTSEGTATISGFIVDRLGSLPHAGRKIELPNVILRIEKVEGMRVESLEVELRPRQERTAAAKKKRRKK